METKVKKKEFSKKLIDDIRSLLWIITISSVILAFYCVHLGYLGTLGWITTLVGLPWSAHGVICSFYLRMAQSDHSIGGITYELAMKDIDKNVNNSSIEEDNEVI